MDRSRLLKSTGGSLIEDGLLVMDGTEFMDWYPTHGFLVFDAIPFNPFQLLL